MRFPALAVLLVLLAGCGGIPTTKLDATDRNTLVPSARLEISLDRSEEAPSRPRGGPGLELGYTRASVSGSQTLAAGQPDVVMGGQSFAAPAQLRGEYGFQYGDVMFRYRHFATETVGIEGLAGLGVSALSIDLAAPGQQAHESRSLGGLALGAGALWRVFSSTTVHARWTGFKGGSAEPYNDKEMTNQRLELHLVQAFGRHVALRAGWTNWSVKSKSEPSSEVHLTFSGPALGLDLMF